jgi:hypothetical protein
MQRAPHGSKPTKFGHRSPELARHMARSRWGAPRRIRLDRGLTDDERWAVYELVETMVAAKKAASS